MGFYRRPSGYRKTGGGVDVDSPDRAVIEPIWKRWESISFDKGFYKRENKELLNLYIPEVIMPKKGRKNQAEEEEESIKSFQKLRHKHSAVESGINSLEHHGLDRCLDKGLGGFKRYCALGSIS